MAEEIITKKSHALSGWPMVLGWLAMLIFAFHACTHMVGAGDTWVAMACGRHFINHGVDTVEPFSANSHKAGPTPKEVETWPAWAQWITDKVGIETVRYWHPTGWVNQNWLTHVIFYWLTHESPFADAETFSFNTLVYWKFAIYILTVICLYYTSRLLGVNPALSAVFACFAMFVGRSFFDIRPAGFSNLLVAAFLLTLVLATYRNIFYIWLIVPLAVFWCNVHGGYIYLFIMLMPFVALNLLTSFSKKRFVSIGLKGIYHTIAAGFVTFLAVIIFNPLHLTNLTHTFIISVSEHAKMWRTVNEWHPAFEWANPVGDEIPFLIMYIIAWLALLVWIVVLVLTSRSVSLYSERGTKSEKRRAKNEKRSYQSSVTNYQLPKIDMALMIIAALTIYMAIRSRRFIPIAAIAACPVIAMFIDQMIRAISATRSFHKQNRLSVSPMPYNLQLFFVLVGVVAVLTFGTWWALKFKHVYLDPWPTDPKLNSVFMRMTASDAKPFYACKFIKDNKLEGKMFNYWTEGGFIAWSQQPDDDTGRTPLQLFMDGRAQAAYDTEVYEVWANIMAAGPTVRGARIRKRRLTTADYVKIGQWIDERLKGHNVWVVLMPAGQFDKPFVRGLEHNSNWPLVFFNNKQKLFVDITTPQGKKLFEGIFSGQTVYPDDFSKNLILAHNMFLFGKGEAAKQQGLDFAIKAFKLEPSQVPMQKIISAARSAELRPRVDDFCKDYIDDFTKNKGLYIKQDGYHHRIVAALVAGDYLQKTSEKQKNTKLAEFYAAKRQEYKNERREMLKRKRW